jgi:hypothetical protein
MQLRLGSRDGVLLTSVNTLSSKMYPSAFAQLNTKSNLNFNHATSYTSTNLIVCDSSLRDVPLAYEPGSMGQIYKDDIGKMLTVLSFISPEVVFYEANHLLGSYDTHTLTPKWVNDLSQLGIEVNPQLNEIFLSTIYSPEATELMSELDNNDFNQLFAKTLVEYYPNILHITDSVKFKDTIDPTDY